MKLGIVGGAGLLGSTTAFVLGMRDVVEEIKLVDLNDNAAKNQAMDMGQAILPFSKTKISAAHYEDLGDCGVILVTANMSTRQVADRSERLKDNMGLLGPITAELKKYCHQDPVVIICTNPVDVFTFMGWKLMGSAPGKVIGFSSNDTMRLKWAVSVVKGVDYRSLDGVCIGEHGDSQVRLLDQMTCNGEPMVFTAEETARIIQLTGDWFKEFSALNVGPKVYISPKAMAKLSPLSCPDTVRLAGLPKKSWLSSTLPFSVLGRSFISSVVTRNISPAPSQSEAVIIGVCTYTNPRSWKNECIAYAATLRTRKTAENRFVLGRR